MTMRAASIPLLLAIAVLCGCSAPHSSRPRAYERDLVAWADRARVAFEAGDYDEAERLFGVALDAARALDDSRAIADNACNLASCSLLLGRTDGVTALLDEARRECHRDERVNGLAAVDVIAAQAALMAGDFGAAERLASAIFAGAPTTSEPALLVHAYLIRARIHLSDGRFDDAAREVTSAERALPSDATGLRADIERVRARIASARGQLLAAADQWDTAAELYQRIGRRSPMLKCLLDASRAYEAGGDPVAAFDRRLRVARAQLASGRVEAARETLSSTEPLVVRLGITARLRFERFAGRLPAPDDVHE